MNVILEEIRIDLTRRIIKKGGLFSIFSSNYVEDSIRGNELLREFFEQLHHKELWEFWGVELGLELVRYRCLYLKYQWVVLSEKNNGDFFNNGVFLP